MARIISIAAIPSSPSHQLLPTLERVQQAVAIGELDKAIAAAIASRQRVLKKPAGTVKVEKAVP